MAGSTSVAPTSSVANGAINPSGEGSAPSSGESSSPGLTYSRRTETANNLSSSGAIQGSGDSGVGGGSGIGGVITSSAPSTSLAQSAENFTTSLAGGKLITPSQAKITSVGGGSEVGGGSGVGSGNVISSPPSIAASAPTTTLSGSPAAYSNEQFASTIPIGSTGFNPATGNYLTELTGGQYKSSNSNEQTSSYGSTTYGSLGTKSTSSASLAGVPLTSSSAPFTISQAENAGYQQVYQGSSKNPVSSELASPTGTIENLYSVGNGEYAFKVSPVGNAGTSYLESLYGNPLSASYYPTSTTNGGFQNLNPGNFDATNVAEHTSIAWLGGTSASGTPLNPNEGFTYQTSLPGFSSSGTGYLTTQQAQIAAEGGNPQGYSIGGSPTNYANYVAQGDIYGTLEQQYGYAYSEGAAKFGTSGGFGSGATQISANIVDSNAFISNNPGGSPTISGIESLSGGKVSPSNPIPTIELNDVSSFGQSTNPNTQGAFQPISSQSFENIAPIVSTSGYYGVNGGAPNYYLSGTTFNPGASVAQYTYTPSSPTLNFGAVDYSGSTTFPTKVSLNDTVAGGLPEGSPLFYGNNYTTELTNQKSVTTETGTLSGQSTSSNLLQDVLAYPELSVVSPALYSGAIGLLEGESSKPTEFTTTTTGIEQTYNNIRTSDGTISYLANSQPYTSIGGTTIPLSPLQASGYVFTQNLLNNQQSALPKQLEQLGVGAASSFGTTGAYLVQGNTQQQAEALGVIAITAAPSAILTPLAIAGVGGEAIGSPTAASLYLGSQGVGRLGSSIIAGAATGSLTNAGFYTGYEYLTGSSPTLGGELTAGLTGAAFGGVIGGAIVEAPEVYGSVRDTVFGKNIEGDSDITNIANINGITSQQAQALTNKAANAGRMSYSETISASDNVGGANLGSTNLLLASRTSETQAVVGNLNAIAEKGNVWYGAPSEEDIAFGAKSPIIYSNEYGQVLSGGTSKGLTYTTSPSFNLLPKTSETDLSQLDVYNQLYSSAHANQGVESQAWTEPSSFQVSSNARATYQAANLKVTGTSDYLEPSFYNPQGGLLGNIKNSVNDFYAKNGLFGAKYLQVQGRVSGSDITAISGNTGAVDTVNVEGGRISVYKNSFLGGSPGNTNLIKSFEVEPSSYASTTLNTLGGENNEFLISSTKGFNVNQAAINEETVGSGYKVVLTDAINDQQIYAQQIGKTSSGDLVSSGNIYNLGAKSTVNPFQLTVESSASKPSLFDEFSEKNVAELNRVSRLGNARANVGQIGTSDYIPATQLMEFNDQFSATQAASRLATNRFGQIPVRSGEDTVENIFSQGGQESASELYGSKLTGGINQVFGEPEIPKDQFIERLYGRGAEYENYQEIPELTYFSAKSLPQLNTAIDTGALEAQGISRVAEPLPASQLGAFNEEVTARGLASTGVGRIAEPIQAGQLEAFNSAFYNRFGTATASSLSGLGVAQISSFKLSESGEANGKEVPISNQYIPEIGTFSGTKQSIGIAGTSYGLEPQSELDVLNSKLPELSEPSSTGGETIDQAGIPTKPFVSFNAQGQILGYAGKENEGIASTSTPSSIVPTTSSPTSGVGQAELQAPAQPAPSPTSSTVNTDALSTVNGAEVFSNVKLASDTTPVVEQQIGGYDPISNAEQAQIGSTLATAAFSGVNTTSIVNSLLASAKKEEGINSLDTLYENEVASEFGLQAGLNALGTSSTQSSVATPQFTVSPQTTSLLSPQLTSSLTPSVTTVQTNPLTTTDLSQSYVETQLETPTQDFTTGYEYATDLDVSDLLATDETQVEETQLNSIEGLGGLSTANPPPIVPVITLPTSNTPDTLDLLDEGKKHHNESDRREYSPSLSAISFPEREKQYEEAYNPDFAAILVRPLREPQRG